MGVMEILVGIVVVALAVGSFIKWSKNASLTRKIEGLYKSISSADKSEVFRDNKDVFFFVGEMLQLAFPKHNLKTLFNQYIELNKIYAARGNDVYGAFRYAKENFHDLKEDEIYSMLGLTILTDGGVKRYEDTFVDRINPFIRKAKAEIKAVEAINRDNQVLGIKENKCLGDRDNAILVAGVKGIEEYLNSMVAEDGTELKYVYKGTAYIKDKKHGLEYDLKKCALIDACTGAEMRRLWFNTYGIKNEEACIDGFVLKEDVIAGKVTLVQSHLVECAETLEVPTNVRAVSMPCSGRPQVSWTEVKGANKYFIYRAKSKDETFAYAGSSVCTEYTDINAEIGKRYFYKVKAADVTNQFAQSELSELTHAICSLPRPVVTVGNDAGTGYVSLVWDEVDEAINYEIYRAESADGPYKRMYRNRATSYVNTKAVEPNVEYYYKVKAIHNNNTANSTDSEIVSGCWRTAE